MTATWWCEHALTADGLRHGVTVTSDGGRITAVADDTAPSAGATPLAGLTVPGFANAHSHAFHRALRSRVQAERGTFWTWRDTMYRAAEHLDPERYHRLGRAVFAEMAQAGIAVVGEFHYVHHQPSGAPYRDANAMGEALMAAATDVGIRITLLDTLYLHGALDVRGYAPVDGMQRRFADGDVDRWVQRVADLEPAASQRVGAAIHSVRAVDPDAMARVAEWAGSTDVPLHAHVSEQQAENDQCAAAFERTPTQVLADAGVLSSRFTAVHATHPTPADIAILASRGSSVCLCPTTERDLGDGLGPVTDFVDGLVYGVLTGVIFAWMWPAAETMIPVP